jgi:tRNA modification GTPase
MMSDSLHATTGSSTSVDTTATRLTSTAAAAIAVIEVRGPDAVRIVGQHWKPHRGSPVLELNAIRYGVFSPQPWRESELDASADSGFAAESVVVQKRAEDRVEIHCHGGQMAADAILGALAQSGARLWTPSEWMQREWPDACEREATEDLLQANTLRTACILTDQKRGALGRAMEQIEGWIAQRQDRLAIASIERCLSLRSLGMHLVKPWRIVLCGPPNVGKSSLLNRMLGYTRAIVHESAGTTRDVLVEGTSIDGWPVALIDSAGVREVDDPVERMGVAKARSVISDADLRLLLVDPTIGWTPEHAELFQLHREATLVVITKSDLVQRVSPNAPWGPDGIQVSALNGNGIEQLMTRISESLVPVVPNPVEAVPFRERHVVWLQGARARCQAPID